MPSSNVELVKERLDIVSLLKGYLTLQPAGKNFKALCPFHSEKTPSFMISPDRQTWHCFGCNTGGDIFSFVMKYENIDFGEALKLLAEKAGIELRHVAGGDYKITGILYDVNRAAADFFVHALKENAAPKEYLAGRKLAAATIEEFELGWAPQQSDALSLLLLQKGFAPEDIVRAGLAVKSDRGLQLDRFRGRIMFPIHNGFGKIVGFTGRILPQFDDGKMGKYVNSPETPIFNKSKLLYGFWKSKNIIRETGAAFLVEGQMDFLMSWQGGVRHAVASSGTALTPDHLTALKRVTDTLLISFDADDAGWNAGERAIDLAEASDFNVKVVLLGGAKDPAEAVERDPAILTQALQHAQPATEFYFQKYLPELADTGKEAGRAPRREADRDYLKRIRAVLAKIMNIMSAVSRSFWLRELSKRTGIEEKTLMEEAAGLSAPLSPQSAAKPPLGAEEKLPLAASRKELLSQCLLAAAYGRNDFGILDDVERDLDEDYRSIARIFRAGKRTSEDLHLDALLNIVLLRAAPFGDVEVAQFKRGLAEIRLKERRRELTEAVQKAESRKDEAALKNALQELSTLQ